MNTPIKHSKDRLPSDRHARQNGLALLEISLAISVFALIALGGVSTLMSGVEQRRQSFLAYRANQSIRDIVGDMQETANLPQDLAQQEGVGAVYNKYHGQTFTLGSLPSGQLTVTCHANEATVPAALGGPQDLNFDGDAQDDLGNVSGGTDLLLIPMTLTVQYAEGTETFSVTAHRLVGQTTQ